VSSRAAPPRVLVLAAVVAAHVGVLLLLVAETRSRLLRGEGETTPLVVLLLRPAEPHPSAASQARPTAFRDRASAAPAIEAAAPRTPAVPGSAIDWAAEAAASATRQVEADEQRARQARALLPSTGGMFSARAKRPQFHWNYARTHRIEPQPGLATVIHLNDQCAIVLFLIIPFAGGCALEKPPVRGDLFEHMHDPEPPEDPGKSEQSQ
jgi:hypothetical protein